MDFICVSDKTAHLLFANTIQLLLQRIIFFWTAAVSTQHRNKAIPKCNNIKQLLHKKLFYSHIVSFFFSKQQKSNNNKKYEKIYVGIEDTRASFVSLTSDVNPSSFSSKCSSKKLISDTFSQWSTDYDRCGVETFVAAIK